MNKEEAKIILQAYREGTEDREDPQFAEALAMLERDPELAEWYRQERAFDEAVRSRLAAVQPPAHLKAEILAGQRVDRVRSLSRRRNILAMAAMMAALLMVGAIVWLSYPRAATASAWQDAMIRTLSSGFRLEFRASSTRGLKAWLAEHPVTPDSHIPAALEDDIGLGCRYWEWRGREVALYCFQVEGGHVLHLFMAPSDGFDPSELSRIPVFASKGNWMTARWQEGQTLYLAASRAEQSVVDQFVLERGS